MPIVLQRSGYNVRGSRTSLLAHLFGVVAAILMLVWLLHFREGIDLDSDLPDRVFNVHPFLMFLGFIFIAGEAMMAYKMVRAERKIQKLVHMLLHLIALVLGIVGVYAAFKFHDESQIPDMYSLHSWLGLITIILFGLQWLIGFVTFWYPTAAQGTRERVAPWHVFLGVLIFLMAVCSAETGLVEKSAFLQLSQGPEARVINFTGLFILFYGVAVGLSALLP
ncbi:probable transmembrane ascorbate ferrireductase 3 [Aristolochia californica]|uniref:probable transmembrane ascorbate ferrireductase 3 n=1 Tax=Aristolochia californica TaxID=171875 RepID=UPI0035E397F1